MSSLSKQIANLGKSSNKVKKGKVASLLFSQSDAAEVDAVTLLELARSSLSELQTFDPRFNEFVSTLFDTSSTTVDRTVLNPDENNKLDQSLSRCLLLLSPYLSMKAAHRVLEYLIRQYQVNEYNVNSLMECSLMYHDSDFFSRLLETLHIDFAGSKWLFLKGYKNQKNLRISRKIIVDQISRDHTLLEFIGNMLFRAVLCAQELPSNIHWQSKISWYTATVTTAIETHTPNEDFLRTLFPQLLRGLSFKHTPVLQVGLYLVIVKLVSSVELSDDNCEALLLSTLNSIPMEFTSEGVTCAASIVNCGSGFNNLSNKAFNLLCNLQPLDEFLAAASIFVDVSLLTSLFLNSYLESLPSTSSNLKTEDICRILRNESSELLISSFIKKVIINYVENHMKISNQVRDCYGELLTCCMECHGEICDVAIKDVMKSLDSNSSSNKMKKQAGFDLLTLCSHSNLRHLPIGDTDTTFILALENHDPKIRLQALNEVIKYSSSSSNKNQINSDLYSCIIRRLYDDDATIVSTMVSTSCKKLLLTCFSNDYILLLKELFSIFNKWNLEMKNNQSFNVSTLTVVENILKSINEICLNNENLLKEDRIIREMVMLANLEQFPQKIYNSKSSGMNKEVSSLISTALKSMKDLSKTCDDFTVFSTLKIETSSSIKTFEDIILLRESIIQSIGKKMGEGKGDGMFDVSWLKIAGRDSLDTITYSQNVQNFIFDCIAASIPYTKKTNLITSLLQDIIEVFPKIQSKLVSLPSSQNKSNNNNNTKKSILNLISNMIIQIPHKEASFKFLQVICYGIFSLPLELFNDLNIQLSLKHLFQYHFQMQPVWFLTNIFRKMNQTNNNQMERNEDYINCQVRSLSISQSFLASILETKGNKSSVESALSQIAFSLPFWMSLLEHPSQLVRNGVLDLLGTVSQYESLCNKTMINLKPPSLFQYDDNKSSSELYQVLPSLSAVDLIKMCCLIYESKAEINMDPKAMSTCVLHLFTANTTDSLWKKGRSNCITFLITHIVNLSIHNECLSMTSIVLKQLSYKLNNNNNNGNKNKDNGNESSLSLYHDVTWPQCNLLVKYLINNHILLCNSLITEEDNMNCNKILNVIINEYIISSIHHKKTGKISEDKLDFIELLFQSVMSEKNKTNSSFILANQSSVKYFLHTVSNQWCNLLTLNQTSRMFQLFIQYVYQFPSFIYSINKVISLLNVSTNDYITCLKECLEKKKTKTKDDKLIQKQKQEEEDGSKLEMVLQVMEISIDNLKKTSVKSIFTLVDCLFTVMEFCISSTTTITGNHVEVNMNKCILYGLNHLLRLITMNDANNQLTDNNPSKSSSSFNTTLESKLDQFISILQLLSSNQSQNQSKDIKTSSIQILVEFAKISPNKIFQSISIMIYKMFTDASINNDINLLHFVENILKEVIPYLNQSNDDNVNIGIFLSNLLNSFEGTNITNIWKLNIFSSLLRSLSSDILPALVLMLDNDETSTRDLMNQLNHRTSPSAQLQSSVKLLECAQLCLQNTGISSSNDEMNWLSLGEMESSFMRLNLNPYLKSQQDRQNLAIKCAEHVASHGENKQFHYQLLNLNEIENKEIQSLYLNICQQLLFCIHDNDDNKEEEAGSSGSEYQSVLSRLFDRILDNLQNLLSVSGFIIMMQELLQGKENQKEWIRKRSIELLTYRVQKMRTSKDGITKQEAALFVDMTPELNSLIENETTNETSSSSLPTALCAIEILAREFAPENPDIFLITMDKVTNLLENINKQSQSKTKNQVNLSLLCSGFLCSATLCSVLGLKAFPQLSKLLPVLLNQLKQIIQEKKKKNKKKKNNNDENSMEAFLLRSILSLFISLFQYLPQFLHPHIEEIVNLTQEDAIMNYNDNDEGDENDMSDNDMTSSSTDLLLTKLYSSIGRGVSIRLLLPNIISLCKTSLIKNKKSSYLILHMFQEMLDKNKSSELKSYSQVITSFLFENLEFREKQYLNLNINDINMIESYVINSLISFVLKFNENELSSFLIVLLRWRKGIDESSTNDAILSRRLTFHKILELLTNKLKSIIIPYFEQFFDDYIIELQIPFNQITSKLTNKTKKQRISKSGDDIDSVIVSSFMNSLESDYSKTVHLELLKYTVSGLKNCFENDREQICMNTKRVELVMSPLIKQLAFASIDVEYVNQVVIPSIAQLAVLCGGDVMWKPLNHSILMQTRDTNPNIRLHALICVKECFSHVGEEFLTVLPESLSFLSELLEDSDPEVEAQCRAVLKYIEAVSGENIDEYL